MVRFSVAFAALLITARQTIILRVFATIGSCAVHHRPALRTGVRWAEYWCTRTPMPVERLNLLSSVAILILPVIALLVVLWGYTQPPLPDEGTGAHIFQLSIVALVPVTLVFVTTANWNRPRRIVQRLVGCAAVTLLAFAALYLLEHVYYAQHLS